MAQAHFVGVNNSKHVALLLRSIGRFGPLSDEENTLLRDAVRAAEALPSGSTLIRQDDAHSQSMVLLSGWVARQRVLADGRRQIFEFLVPGDVVGLGQFGHALATSVALTPIIVARMGVLQDAVADALGPYQGLSTFVRGMMEREAAHHLNHIVRIGRLTAYERVIHLMLELQNRLDEVGLVAAAGFPLPLTQEMLADALGLSIVHVNRTLQQLRRDRMLVLRDSVATLLEPSLASGWTDVRRRPLRTEHVAS